MSSSAARSAAPKQTGASASPISGQPAPAAGQKQTGATSAPAAQKPSSDAGSTPRLPVSSSAVKSLGSAAAPISPKVAGVPLPPAGPTSSADPKPSGEPGPRTSSKSAGVGRATGPSPEKETSKKPDGAGSVLCPPVKLSNTWQLQPLRYKLVALVRWTEVRCKKGEVVERNRAPKSFPSTRQWVALSGKHLLFFRYPVERHLEAVYDLSRMKVTDVDEISKTDTCVMLHNVNRAGASDLDSFKKLLIASGSGKTPAPSIQSSAQTTGTVSFRVDTLWDAYIWSLGVISSLSNLPFPENPTSKLSQNLAASPHRLLGDPGVLSIADTAANERRNAVPSAAVTAMYASGATRAQLSSDGETLTAVFPNVTLADATLRKVFSGYYAPQGIPTSAFRPGVMRAPRRLTYKEARQIHLAQRLREDAESGLLDTRAHHEHALSVDMNPYAIDFLEIPTKQDPIYALPLPPRDPLTGLPLHPRVLEELPVFGIDLRPPKIVTSAEARGDHAAFHRIVPPGTEREVTIPSLEEAAPIDFAASSALAALDVQREREVAVARQARARQLEEMRAQMAVALTRPWDRDNEDTSSLTSLPASVRQLRTPIPGVNAPSRLSMSPVRSPSRKHARDMPNDAAFRQLALAAGLTEADVRQFERAERTHQEQYVSFFDGAAGYNNGIKDLRQLAGQAKIARADTTM